MNLRQAMNITLTGYGPGSQFTLAEWLHARELFRKNEKAAMAQVNIKPFNPAETA